MTRNQKNFLFPVMWAKTKQMTKPKTKHALHRGWTKLMLDRCRDLVQHPNQLRPMATEATDKDDEEAHALYHYTNPPGYGG